MVRLQTEAQNNLDQVSEIYFRNQRKATRYTIIYTITTKGQFRDANSSKPHVFVLGEEIRVPRGNLHYPGRKKNSRTHTIRFPELQQSQTTDKGQCKIMRFLGTESFHRDNNHVCYLFLESALSQMLPHAIHAE